MQSTVLERAHSHNDYLRNRPLFDALDNGLASVEVDVFLVGGDLLVAHSSAELKPEKTIEAMYLDPLQNRIKANGGRVYRGYDKTLWVLVDVKRDGLNAYRTLVSKLERYPELSYKNGKGAVRFVISGDRAVDAIIADGGRYAALDGRWADLEKNISPEVMPWVSEDWTDHFAWIGAGPFPAEASNKLKSMVETVHRLGRKLRFWGAPDLESIYQVQWQAGVDFLNTDKPASLRNWILRQPGHSGKQRGPADDVGGTGPKEG